MLRGGGSRHGNRWPRFGIANRQQALAHQAYFGINFLLEAREVLVAEAEVLDADLNVAAVEDAHRDTLAMQSRQGRYPEIVVAPAYGDAGASILG